MPIYSLKFQNVSNCFLLPSIGILLMRGSTVFDELGAATNACARNHVLVERVLLKAFRGGVCKVSGRNIDVKIVS